MVALHLEQAVAEDQRPVSLGTAVVEQRRRDCGVQLKVDLNAVALLGSDPLAGGVESEALLVVALDDLFQLPAGQRHSVAGTSSQQTIDIHPTAGLQRQSKAIGLVAKVLAQVLADLNQLRLVHGSPELLANSCVSSVCHDTLDARELAKVHQQAPGENLLLTCRARVQNVSLVNSQIVDLFRHRAESPAHARLRDRVSNRFSPGAQPPLYPAKSFGIMALLGVRRSYPLYRPPASTTATVEFSRLSSFADGPGAKRHPLGTDRGRTGRPDVGRSRRLQSGLG
jgi:hypothetical protein